MRSTRRPLARRRRPRTRHLELGLVVQRGPTPRRDRPRPTHRVRDSIPTNNGSVNPPIHLHKTQGTPSPPLNPGRFTLTLHNQTTVHGQAPESPTTLITKPVENHPQHSPQNPWRTTRNTGSKTRGEPPATLEAKPAATLTTKPVANHPQMLGAASNPVLIRPNHLAEKTGGNACRQTGGKPVARTGSNRNGNQTTAKTAISAM